MDLIRRWRRRAAAKKIASYLPGELARSYGASASYNRAQIDSALRRCRVSASHANIAYAGFLPFNLFVEIFPDASPEEYEVTRALYGKYFPAGRSAYAFENTMSETTRQAIPFS